MTLLVIALIAMPLSVFLQVSHGVTTTNCTIVGQSTSCHPSSGGGGATFGGTQRKVFEANGYWWIFWETGSAIDYQYCQASSVTSCAVTADWSTAASFTAQGWTASSGSGQGFSAWLVTSGSNYYLVYADAPTNGGTTFWWGIAQLGTGSIAFLAQDQSFSLLSSHTGTGTASISITVDGNNYLWIGVFTHNGGSYYEDVYECTVNIVSSPTGCETTSNWDTTTTFLLAETNGILDAPEVLPLTSSGNYYVALVYVDAATAGTGGPMDVYVAQSGQQSGGLILWAATCGSGSTSTTPTACNTSSNITPATTSISSGGGVGGYFYSATSSGATIYIAAEISQAAIYYFSYTVGSASYSTDISFVGGLSANIYFTLSYSGTNVILTYQPQGSDNVVFTWATMAGVSGGTAAWSANTNLAVNTEWSQPEPSASFNSFTVGSYNLIGVMWDTGVTNPTNPNTNRIRFAVESMSTSGVVNFPVTVTLTLNEYNSPSSGNSKISSTNFFPISYTTSAGVTNTAYYTSSTGAVMTISNVLSYTNFQIAEQSSGSTGAEKWCLVYGTGCPNGQASTFTTVGASDGLTLAYYYYDQLYEPNLYAIATPSIYTLWATSTSTFATANYESTNLGAPASDTAGNFQLWPNPATATPYATPRVSLYDSANGYEESTYWVRARDSTPACTGLTTYPVPGSATTCAPTVSFGVPFGTTTSATPTVLTDTLATWQASQWVGYQLEYTSGPASGQFLPITSSGATTLTTTVAFNPPPTPTGGDSFTVLEPSVTVNNPSGVTLPSTGPAVTTYVPIVISNSQPSATSANFQQMVTVDSNTFAQYEASNLQNVEFFTSSGAILPSWLESGASSTSSSTTYWVNLGTNTVPAGTLGSTLFSGTTTSTTAKILTDTSASWTAQAYVNDYLDYSTGPAAGQWLPIIANAATTLTTETAAAPYIGDLFSPAPTAAGGDSFKVAYINPGTLTIYMGFVGQSNNLLSSAGPTGEAPQLSSVYGQYDDGAVVFPTFYQNFAGTSLSATWTQLLPVSGTTSSETATTLTVSGSPWTANSLVGETVTITSGADAGEARAITANTANTITVGVSFVPTPSGAVTFTVTGTTVYQNNGLTLTTPATSTWGGVVTGSGISTSTPMTFDADVVSVYGVAAGIGINVGNAYNSNGYSLNFWGGSVSSGNMEGSQTNTGNPNMAIEDGVMGQSWVSGTLQYYYRDYSQTDGTLATYALPGSAYYAIGAWSSSANSQIQVQWARLRVNGPQGVMPSAVVGPAYPTTANPVTVKEFVPIQITNTQATATPYFYQVDVNVTSSTYFKYENALLQNVEFFTDSNPLTTAGTVLPSWLENGNSNTATDSVFWVRLPYSLAATGGAGAMTTIYMGFASVPTNLFAYDNWYNGVNGFVGEAPTLSTGNGYGVYDNGANVFNFYDDFSGKSLSANWQTDSTFGTALGAQLIIGKLTTNTCDANLPTSTGSSSGINTPGGSAFDSSGDLWVVDRCDNRILEYTAASLSSNNPTPTLVLGQNAFNIGLPNEGAPVSSAGLFDPTGIAFDASGNLWVADSGNNRVLEFTTPFSTGEAASKVVGQAAFNTNGAATSATGLSNPSEIAINSGNLWVADTNNNRVIEFPSLSSLPATGGTATIAVGQTSLAAGGSGESATALWGPTGIAFDSSGDLWVADTFNNRVTGYTAASLSADGPSASWLIGQDAMNLWTVNAGQPIALIGSSGLFNPTSVAFDGSGNLWVADTLNNRVLKFPASQLNTFATSSGTTTSATGNVLTDTNQNWGSNIFVGEILWYTSGPAAGQYLPITGNAAHTITTSTSFNPVPTAGGGNTFTVLPAGTVVLGQSVLTSGPPNEGSNYVSASGLYAPSTLTFDSSGNLWVSDMQNNRVLKFASGSLSSSGASASLVVGQSVFTSGISTADAPSAVSLNEPTDEAFDSSGNLWVVDTGNNRIIEFKTPFYTGEPASLVLGQSSFTTSGSGTSSTTLNGPTYLAFDSHGDLWVSDSGNNRVLEYTAPLYSGEPANVVVGQAGFGSSGTGDTAATLNDPQGIAFDSAGDLWVSDSLNNRVIMFPASSLSSSGPSATIAEGQGSLTTGTAGIGPTALHDPMGITFDPYGNLWVADALNNRVVQFPYSSLSSSGGTENLVIGQTTLSSNYPNEGGNVNGNGLNYPTSVAFDKWGELWVSDTGNNRVMQYVPAYDASFTNGQVENNYEGPNNIDIGVPDRFDYQSITTTTLSNPRGLAFDTLDDLWIADSGNSRAWTSAAGTAGQAINVDNGISIKYTSTTMGIVSEATVNPQTNILEFSSFFSNINSGDTLDSYTTPAANTPAPTQGNYLYAVTTGSLNAANGAILENKGTVGTVLLNYLSVPLQTPTIIDFVPYMQTPGVAQPDGLEPYPATNYVYVDTNNMATSVGNWWALRNSTAAVTQALSGQPGERWAAWPNGLNPTLVSPYQVIPAVLYFHQYEETFSVNPAGLVTTFDSGLSWEMIGTQYGNVSSPVANFYTGLTTQQQYVDAGTTITFPATAVGSPFGTRWQNSNNQSQTAIISGPLTCTTLCTSYYYKQYDQYLDYATRDGSTMPVAQKLVFTYSAFGSPYSQLIPASTRQVWVDALTSASATPLVAGGGVTQISGTTSGATSTTITVASANWVANAYVGDYLEFTSGPASGEAGRIISNTATTITVATAFSPPPTPGGGDTFNVVTLYERWVVPVPTQTITTSFQLPNPLYYYHQYLENLGPYKTSDYNAIPSGDGTPKLSLIVNGTKVNHLLNFTGTAVTKWADALVGVSPPEQDNVTATIAGMASERWAPEVGSWVLNGTNTIAGHSGIIGPYGNQTIVYDHQWQIVYNVSPGSASATISSQTPIAHSLGRPYTVQPQGTLDWQTTPDYIQASSSNSSLVFSSWSRTGNICFNVLGVCSQSTTSSAAEAKLSATPTSITANFELQNGITFIQTGIPNGAATWTALIYQSGNLYKVGASSSSALSIVLGYGSYTFVLPSPVLNPAGNIRYFPSPTTGSFVLNSSNPSHEQLVSFATQYRLSASTDPVGYTPITATGTNGSSPGTPFDVSPVTSAGVWLLPGSTATLTESCGCGSIFVEWLGNQTSSTSSVNIPSMTNPVRETAEFNVPLSLSIVPSLETGYTGENLTSTVYVYGGAGTVTLTTGPLPPGITVYYSLPSGAYHTSVNFPADAQNPPYGEPVTMLIVISPKSSLYGALNFTVNAVDTGNQNTNPPIPIDHASGTYTLDIITPKAVIAGYTTTPYAITTPDQTAMFAERGHWYIFYYTGSELVYAYSNDSKGQIWNAPIPVPSTPQTAGIQGNSFAVTASMVNVGFGNGTELPEIYYILTPSSNGTVSLNKFQPSVSSFFYNYGYIARNGTIVWDQKSQPFKQEIASPTCQFGCPPGVQREYPDGKPALMVDNATGQLWASFPVLYQYNGSTYCSSSPTCLQWHVQVWNTQIPTDVPNPKTPQALWSSGSFPTGDIAVTGSPFATTVTEQLLTVNGQNHADVLIIWAGDTDSAPQIYSWAFGVENNYSCSPGGQYALYGQQSQATVEGDNIYFAGLAAVAPNTLGVNFYSFNYNQALVGCNPSPYSVPQDVAPGYNIPMSELVDNSWHVTIAFSNGNLLVGFGVNSQLTFAVGTASGNPPTWTWFVPPSGIQGFADVVGGLSSDSAASGTQVAMCWVDTIAGTNSEYTVDFVLS